MLAPAMNIISQIACGKIHTTLSVVLLAACAANLALLCAFLVSPRPARADAGARAIPTVLALLEAEGIPVVAATVSRPSLDDVYLRHASRAFHEADLKGAA